MKVIIGNFLMVGFGFKVIYKVVKLKKVIFEDVSVVIVGVGGNIVNIYVELLVS